MPPLFLRGQLGGCTYVALVNGGKQALRSSPATGAGTLLPKSCNYQFKDPCADLPGHLSSENQDSGIEQFLSSAGKKQFLFREKSEMSSSKCF